MRDAKEEHETDPRDLADAYVILDGVEVLVTYPERDYPDWEPEPETFRNYTARMTRRVATDQ